MDHLHDAFSYMIFRDLNFIDWVHRGGVITKGPYYDQRSNTWKVDVAEKEKTEDAEFEVIETKLKEPAL